MKKLFFVITLIAPLCNAEDMSQWNQFVCDGKYTQITKNIVIDKDVQSKAGFAYMKSNERVIVELMGVYDKLVADKSETIPNFSSSSVSSNSEFISGGYNQFSAYSFNSKFQKKNNILTLNYNIGEVITSYIGKCYKKEFLF
jgi:hypothetical protein